MMASGKKSEARRIKIAERRAEVLRLSQEGLGPRDIAHRLGVSVTTIRRDLDTLMQEIWQETDGSSDRIEQALELRKSGLSYRDIGRRLGVSHSTALRDVKAGLAELDGQNAENAMELRRLIELRLTDALMAISTKVLSGDLKAIGRWVQINQELGKLYGVYEPKRITISMLVGLFDDDEFLRAWQELEAAGKNMSGLAAQFNEFVKQAAQEMKAKRDADG